MQDPSIIKHIRDILILPFTVTVIIPWLIYDKHQALFNATIFLKVIGIILFVCGLILFLRTVYLFKTIGKGTLAPWTPTQKLVIAGPYRYCRNPMISGVFFILLGETLLLNSTNILIEALIFFAFNTIYFILIEEPDLYKRFGEEYLVYKKNVPRWIPKLKAYKPQK
ncbi:methyltransferase family protein [Terrimonas pollutisoli]|uniref:methyltransferase family protein n=1 Tax=Terrimonas pollutisoli TaxID=3034147 RepID=UPI0023EC9242|nr:isoprenylcysteine carboxylmethyltransferase family protein [Terrimonas sp. H1YJ31]